MKVKVRNGYVLHLSKGRYARGGQVLDLKKEEMKGQEWKVEKVKESTAKSLEKPPKDRAMEAPGKSK